ncbi:hypothetical protein DYU11_27945 [Fibrisoma montanum]|uniref:DUF4386 family protein n=1 Tax=Fibrisoma montanum TaxID=2305895 RepID=A0A418LYF6_9BACT|nr:hypothetical protein [Fibrisoma montanum]RIV18413.1 hypothetical protein DYU11_27945 [Fibrisoma montanum]
MRQTLIVLGVICTIGCFFGFCVALVDIVQDVKTGVYKANFQEVALEILGFSLYTALAFRFLRSKIPLV